MSSGGVFFVVMLAAIVLILFLAWLYVRWQLEYGEAQREAAALAEFGPLFDMTPAAKHVTQDRSSQRLRYTTDWEAMRRQAGR
jgi:hypothetical protein